MIPNPRGMDEITITNRINNRAKDSEVMDGLQVGRVVHYVVATGEHRAAFITKLHGTNGTINLTYFNDGWFDVQEHNDKRDTIRVTSATYSEEPVAGTWHWIERA